MTPDASDSPFTVKALEMLKRSIDVHPDGAYWFDADNRFVYVNDAACRILGYSREQLLEMSVPDVNPAATVERLRQVWERLRRDGQFFSESTHRRSDGSEFSVEIVTAYVVVDGREFACGFARDVTERRRAEGSLRESERLLIESQRVARLGHYDFDALSGHWSSSLVLDEVFGIDAGFTRDVQGWIRIVHPDDRESMHRYLTDSVIRAGRPFDREYRIRRVSDGVDRWVHGLGHLAFDGSGRTTRMFGVIQDITERRVTEQALSEKSRELEAFFGNALELLCIADTDGHFLRVNREWQRTLGYRVDELEGRSFVDFVHPDDLPATLEAVRDLGAQKQVFDFVNRYLCRDGSYRWIEWRSIPAGRLVYAAARDVTERRREEAKRLELERQLLHAQKLESLGVLAGGIAHDFNNLLMGILGSLELAAAAVPTAGSGATAIEQAVQAARRASDLTRQMLAYSGKGRFEIARVDLNALVQENVGLFRSAVARTTTLEVSLSDMDPAIDADPGQAQQVIMNLITNAAEALGGRPGTVTVATGVRECGADCLAASRLSEKPAPGRFAYVEVRDTGCGMDRETLDRVFDPFFTTKFTGRGLGMSVVIGIVRGHKGAILIDSTPGRGSLVTVLLPVSTLSAADGRGAHAAATRIDPVPTQGLILVVDDEDVVRRPCIEYLTHRGFAAAGASGGAAALDLFAARAGEIACVVLDLTMPGLSGAAVFAELARLRPGLPVILSSGFSEDAAFQDFGELRPAGFLQKPFRLEALVREITRVLRERGGPAAAAG